MRVSFGIWGRRALGAVGLLVVLAGCGEGEPAALSGEPAEEPATDPAANNDWQSAVVGRIGDSEYQVGGEVALSFGNRAQNLRAQFVQGGVRLEKRDAAPQVLSPGGGDFAIAIQTAAFGRAGRTWAAGVGEARVGDCDATGRVDVRGDCLRRVERDGDGFVEWWENRPEGLEQGWTITERPLGDGPLVVEIEVDSAYEADADGVTLVVGTSRLRYAGLRAWDARGTALPARFDGLRMLVDDAEAVYPIEVDPLITTPGWTAGGPQPYAAFGVSVASAGDVNGDGFGDVIVGAYGYDIGWTNAGGAFLYLGSVSGLAGSAAWTAGGDQASAQFGVSVASAGDVNGDGFGDVIVGANNSGQTGEGRAFLYLGSAAGLSAGPAWTGEPNQDGASFGYSVASAGDVNGDGFGDVIVGAIGYDNGQTDEGGAFLYLGSASGLATAPAWTAESNQAGPWFGMSVTSAGDVNGDGFGDVIVGARQYDNGQTDEGRAYLYLGSASGLAAAPAWTAESNQASAEFGTSVASAGDVNGDGFSDVIVGAPLYTNGQAGEGRAFLYLGSASGLAATPAWTAESDQASAYFGVSVASAGDVNGDGYADVIVGANGYTSVQTADGRVFLYLGSASGLAAAPASTAESDQDNAAFGASVASAGDVNGDGFCDVIVGAVNYSLNGYQPQGRAFLYLGSASALAATAAWLVESNQAGAETGYAVASAGDVDGDGYGDVLLGGRYYDNGQTDEGRAFFYFGSASGVASTTPAWSAESNQPDADPPLVSRTT